MFQSFRPAFRSFISSTPRVSTTARPLRPSPARTMSLLRPDYNYPFLSRAIDDFDTLWRRPAGSGSAVVHSPRFDVHETPDSYHLDGELPGVEKKDIDVAFTDQDTLQIQGHSEHKTTSEDPEHTWWCSERSVGDFRRSFSFPTPVDREHIDASFTNGVLSIKVPKVGEKPTGKRIDIK